MDRPPVRQFTCALRVTGNRIDYLGMPGSTDFRQLNREVHDMATDNVPDIKSFEEWREDQEVVYTLLVEVNDTEVYETTAASFDDLGYSGSKAERRELAELQDQYNDYVEENTPDDDSEN